MFHFEKPFAARQRDYRPFPMRPLKGKPLKLPFCSPQLVIQR